MFPALRAQYVDTGKVRWVFRHFPLSAEAARVSQASECADQQGRFWDYAALLFANQNALDDVNLVNYAAQLGLDTPAFQSCLTSGAEAARVNADIASAFELGVDATPTFFIGTRPVTGFMSTEQFSALLDQALAAAALQR